MKTLVTVAAKIDREVVKIEVAFGVSSVNAENFSLEYVLHNHLIDFIHKIIYFSL